MVETRRQQLKRVRAQAFDSIQGTQSAFVNLLSRVDAKSVITFKRVNKYWHSSLSNKYFSELQLNQARENPSFVACPRMDRRMNLYSMKPGSFKLVDLNTIDPAERNPDDDYMYMISSFNGLICCVNSVSEENVNDKFYDLQIWICNPCSEETLLLPQGRPSYEFEPSVGVAYGSDIGDYRVFRIFSSGKKIPEERTVEGYYVREGQILTKYRYALAYECEVYSSSTGTWENIGPVPCVPMKSSFNPYRCGHVFVGGKIYWLVSLDDEGEILCVDLEGRFEVMTLPEYPEDLPDEDKITEATHLINLRGSLSLVVLHTDYMEIWVWKEEGKECSWVPLCEELIPIPFDEDDVVLGMASSKNQILCLTQTHWCSYDVDTKVWNKRKADSGGFVNPTVFPFTESTLPCNMAV